VRRLAAAAVLLLVPACSDDGGGGGEQFPSVGLIVGQESVDGEVADTLVVIDPEHSEPETIDLDGLGRGIPVGRQALYEVADGIVLVEADDAEAHDLGVGIGEQDLLLTPGIVEGGGQRFTVLLSSAGQPTRLVDLEEQETTDLAEGTVVTGAEFTPDEAWLMLNTEDGPVLLPTDDPAAATDLGNGAGQLTADGESVLLTGSDGVRLHAIEGGAEVAITDEPTAALAVGDKVLLVRDDEAVLVEPGSDDVLASAPFTAGAAAPIALDSTVLLPAGAGRGWTFIDAEAATATHLDDLDGLRSAVPGVQPTRWVPFEAPSRANREVVGVDLVDGSVTDVRRLPPDEEIESFFALAPTGPWALALTNRRGGGRTILVNLETGAIEELASRIQGAAFSPDGEQVTWSEGASGELHVAPVGDPSAGDVVADGVALPIWLSG
jgi:hypothetical protein